MSQLIDDYLRAATEWGVAMNAAKARTANSIVTQIDGLFRRIEQSGQQHVLFAHVDGDNDAVSFLIASHLKDVDKGKAISVYERLLGSKLPSIALSSMYILKEMRK